MVVGPKNHEIWISALLSQVKTSKLKILLIHHHPPFSPSVADWHSFQGSKKVSLVIDHDGFRHRFINLCLNARVLKLVCHFFCCCLT